MKTIKCDKIKAGDDVDVIRKQLLKMKNHAVKNNNHIDDKLTAQQFLSATSDNAVQLKGFRSENDITMSCAFVKNNTLRFSVLFEFEKKNKVNKVYRDFMKEAESLFSPLYDCKITPKGENIYYLNMYKDLD